MRDMTMREKTNYKTPIVIGQLTEFNTTCDDREAYHAKDMERMLRAEAQRRGLVLYYGDYAFAKRAVIIDPTPREYKDKDYSKIDEFYDWCHENHLLYKEKSSPWDAEYFGNRHRHEFSTKGDYLVDEDWRGNKTIWKAPNKDAWYHYTYCTEFYTRRPHTTLDMETATKLLQEHLDFLTETYGYNKRTAKLQEGRYGFEKEGTCVQRIAVYDGDGSRGSFDFEQAYDYAIIYPEEGLVVYCDPQHGNGCNYHIEGELNISLMPEKLAC